MNPTLTIVWIALAVSQVIYLFMPVPASENTAPQPMATVVGLGVVAAAEAAGILLWLRVRAFEPIRSGRLDPGSQAGQAQLFTALMVAWVLAESIAIYGLVLRFLRFDLVHTVPFALAGAVLLFAGRPWSRRLTAPVSSGELGGRGTPIG